jgi:Tfp pilus assembly protein PilO
VRSSVRLWLLGGVLVIVALLGGGWLVGAAPLLDAAAQAATSQQTAESQTHLMRLRLGQLQAASQRIDELKAQAAAGERAVPSRLDAEAFIRRVNEVAAKDGLTVGSIVPGDAQAYTSPAPAVVATGTPVGAAPSASPSPTPAPSAAAAAATPVTAATDPLITASDLVVIPITVTVQGSTAETLQFAHDIQNDERLFLVNGFSTTQSGSGSGVAATLKGYVYALKG